jgi:hypothetical protein
MTNNSRRRYHDELDVKGEFTLQAESLASSRPCELGGTIRDHAWCRCRSRGRCLATTSA